MKNKIRLDTLTDVRVFCNVVDKIDADVYLIDGSTQFKVNAKSMLGCLLSQAEWAETYVMSDKDIYTAIQRWIIIE
jgi:hypothetical protein